jgi:multimeric flavodoxin WrbA
MKIIAINGSPRKTWNTSILLRKVLEGAASRGADTELVNIYELSYRGCISCFACKTNDGPSYGRCAVKDDLTPLLEKIRYTDALVLGSPIYYGAVTGEMRSFMERMLFPYSTYTDPFGSIFPKKIQTGFIYTMNATEESSKERGYHHHINLNETAMRSIFGKSESLMSYDTFQFEDYSKVYAPRFNPEKKAERRAKIFPLDCEKAYKMGERLAG